jgi:hypothetical protein
MEKNGHEPMVVGRERVACQCGGGQFFVVKNISRKFQIIMHNAIRAHDYMAMRDMPPVIPQTNILNSTP